jgi:hypothetical protein
MQRLLNILLLLFVCVGAVSEAQGQIVLRAGAFATGGGMLSNTTYAAVGTIGQTVIGRSTGATFAASAGIWGNGGVILDVEEHPVAGTSGEFALRQNYPNPFNPTTCIRIAVGAAIGQRPTEGRVRLVVYDLLGREVAVLVNEEKPPGVYDVTWNASGYASGVYIYRMSVGSVTESRKMILMK